MDVQRDKASLMNVRNLLLTMPPKATILVGIGCIVVEALMHPVAKSQTNIFLSRASPIDTNKRSSSEKANAAMPKSCSANLYTSFFFSKSHTTTSAFSPNCPEASSFPYIT